METPKYPVVPSATPTLTGFLQPEVMGIYFLALEPFAVQSALGLGSPAPKASLPMFIYHT